MCLTATKAENKTGLSYTSSSLNKLFVTDISSVTMYIAAALHADSYRWSGEFKAKKKKK
jgi:hypothetical protein